MLQQITIPQINANASPLVNTTIQLMTGLCAVSQANTSRVTTSAVASEANLTITVNETGVYRYEAAWMIYATANGINTGFQFNLNGGGSATINRGGVTIVASNNHSLTPTQSGLWIPNGAMGNSVFGLDGTTLTTSVGNPDMVIITGILVINGAGTIIPQWSQAVSNSNATNMLANSYVMLTKVG